MFRNSLVSTRKLLIRRTLPAKNTSERYASSSTSLESRRINHCQRQTLLPVGQFFITSRQLMGSARNPILPELRTLLPVGQSILLRGQLLPNHFNFREASSTFQIPNVSELVCNFLNMARCVDLNNLKDAPPPVFWASMAMVGVQLGSPFLELIGGYSSTLTYLQLYTASASLIWNGGQKWGLALFDKHPKLKPDWNTMKLALVPVGFAVTGLLLPYPLGFLTVASGQLVALYCDLKSCAYPPWSIAAKSLVALASSIGLLLALSAYVLFHNRENAKKKEKEKKRDDDLPPPEEADDATKKKDTPPP